MVSKHTCYAFYTAEDVQPVNLCEVAQMHTAFLTPEQL